jgi:hypothetical protein
LTRLAQDNSSAFASLLGKCLPHTLAADESGGGVGVHIKFTRVVVWPDGRRETMPDSSHALPRPYWREFAPLMQMRLSFFKILKFCGGSVFCFSE